MGLNKTIYRASRRSLIAALLLYSSVSFAEVSYEFSGFGTLGYAVSDQSYTYLKYIDDDGTIDKDSLIAGQFDILFNPKFSTTIQAQYAPDASSDTGWAPKLSLAFLSYRPANDWLIRAGKLRLPGYLNTENRDIGVSYDYARLPVEFDSLSPTYDFWGASVNKAFVLDEGDLYWDLYYGQEHVDLRLYFRDIGSYYLPIDIQVVGTTVKYQTLENTYLAGLHYAVSSNDSDEFIWHDSAVYQDAGYYSYDGAEVEDDMEYVIFTGGADIHLGNDVRMATEFSVRQIHGDMVHGQNSYSGYISLRRQFGNWTPYAFYSRIRSDSDQLDFYKDVNSVNTGNDLIDSLQRSIADGYMCYDQYSIAVGTSYSLSPRSKIKAEAMLTHVGIVSAMVDSSGTDSISDSDIAIFSLSYSFAF